MSLKPSVRAAKRGFTLMELLIVIAIIGILSAVVIVSSQASRSKARNAAVMGQMDQYVKALELYYSNNGMYPATNAARTARWCIGDNPPGQCLGSSLTPNATYSNTSAINVALRLHMRVLPRFAQPSGSLNYSSPAYSGCSGSGMANTSCTVRDYSFWFVLEGINKDCGRATVANANLSGAYTLCRLQNLQ